MASPLGLDTTAQVPTAAVLRPHAPNLWRGPRPGPPSLASRAAAPRCHIWLQRLGLWHHFHFSKNGFPGGSAVKTLSANAGDTGSVPGWGRSPGGGHGNPLQYSYLGNSMDRGAWWAPLLKATLQLLLGKNNSLNKYLLNEWILTR